MIKNLFLADDDIDDCLLFQQALHHVLADAVLTTVHDGVQLMEALMDDITSPLPDVLFLDLNMPRKNGFESLTEIKQNVRLSHLPVIIYSTANHVDVIDSLYDNGAHYYIRKPSKFSEIKSVIQKALHLIMHNNNARPSRERFLLAVD